jgi:glutathione S-transferase
MSLHLVIGNKNYSSWSFRPWLAMKVAGITFDETVISLDAADFKTRVLALGGSGRVPVLCDDDVRVWESLAILEYLSEKFPAAGFMAQESCGTRACSRGCIGDACGICFATASPADEHRAAGEIPSS